MGKAIIKATIINENIEVIGAVAPKGRSYIGQDLGIISDFGKKIDIYVSSDEEIISECDIVVECTNRVSSLEIMNLCLENNKPFVSGTTGFSEEDKKLFIKAGEKYQLY